MKIRENKLQKLDYSQVRALYRVHGTTARDFAASLLGGDPFQARGVVRKLFLAMVGMHVESVASAEKLPLWIANQVVARCLEQTGNGEVSDWDEYLEKEKAEREDEGRAEKAAAEEKKASNVIPFRPRAEKAATRAARATLASSTDSTDSTASKSTDDAARAALDGRGPAVDTDRPEVP